MPFPVLIRRTYRLPDGLAGRCDSKRGFRIHTAWPAHDAVSRGRDEYRSKKREALGNALLQDARPDWGALGWYRPGA